MTVFDKREGLPSVSAREIPVGTTFTGMIGFTHSTYLRTYSGVVDLNNPSRDWISINGESNSGLPSVENYRTARAILTLN